MKYKKDYYKILGIEPNATPEEIKQAYRRLVILNEPDRNPARQAAVQMQEINEAYYILGNKNERIKYDIGCGNSFASTQPSATSDRVNKTTFENLKLFEKEGFGKGFIAVVGIAGCLFLLSFAEPFFSPEFVKIFNCIKLSLIPVTLSMFLWMSFKSKEKEKQCPKCGKPQAAENLGEKPLGIFRRASQTNSTNSKDEPLYTYEKYKIHYRCKYCSYEWQYIKTRRLE